MRLAASLPSIHHARCCKISYAVDGRRTMFNWLGGSGVQSSPDYTFWDSTLAQDPKDRIRFLRPNLSYHDKPPPRSKDLHIIPFWTMMYTVSWKAMAMNIKSGTSRLGQTPIQSDFGFTVAAVPKDHWASGLVLSDTAWELYGNQLDMSYEPPVPTFQDGQVDRAEWFKHLRIPSEVPGFVCGYPILSEQYFCKTFSDEYNSVEAATEAGEMGGAEWRWNVSLTEPMLTFAIPTYRVVEKTMSGGQMVYRDDSQVYANSEANIARFELPSEPPKIVTRANSRLNGVPAFFVTSRSTVREGDARPPAQKSWRENSSLARGARRLQLADRIVAVTKDARVNWEDSNIISAGLNSGKGDDLFRLIEWETRRLVNQSPGSPPRAYTPSSVKSSPKRPSTLRPSSLKPSGLAKSSARTTVPAPKTPSAPSTIMHDPKGLYRKLNITPTEAFLDPKRQEDVQKRLASSLSILKLMYQPQRQAHLGGYKALTASMEEAYNHLVPLENRKAYQRAAKE